MLGIIALVITLIVVFPPLLYPAIIIVGIYLAVKIRNGLLTSSRKPGRV